MDARTARVELLDASHGQAMLGINRACPIVSDLTFFFDRGDDFFRWPSSVYERFFYAGVFHDDRLVGYCMVGLLRAWTGDEFGWLAVLGDARMLPEHRGLGWIEEALALLADVVPGNVHHGVFIIKEGNRSADRLRARFRLEGYAVTPVGRLTTQNLFLVRRMKPRTGVVVTTATPDDLTAIVDLLREQWQGRLFAPSVSAESLLRVICQPGLGWSGPIWRARTARWSASSAPGTWARSTPPGFCRTPAERTSSGDCMRLCGQILHDAAPLPAPGGAFKSLTITTMATRAGDTEMLRALLVAVNNDHLDQGFQMMHVGDTVPSGHNPALRSWYRQGFCSEIHLITAARTPLPCRTASGALSGSGLDLILTARRATGVGPAARCLDRRGLGGERASGQPAPPTCRVPAADRSRRVRGVSGNPARPQLHDPSRYM